jgi:hypothetical protein
MLVLSTPLVNCCPSTFSLVILPLNIIWDEKGSGDREIDGDGKVDENKEINGDKDGKGRELFNLFLQFQLKKSRCTIAQ